MARPTGKGDKSAISVAIVFELEKQLGKLNADLKKSALIFTDTWNKQMQAGFQEQVTIARTAYDTLTKGSRHLKSLETTSNTIGVDAAKKTLMFLDAVIERGYGLDEAYDVVTHSMSVYANITKNAGMSMMETYNDIAKVIDGVRESQNMSLEDISKNAEKAKIFNKDIIKSIIEYKKKSMSELYNTDMPTINKTLNKDKSTDDDIEKIQRLQKLMTELEPIAQKYNISMAEAMSKFNYRAKDDAGNIKNAEKAIRRSIRLYVSDLQDVGDAFAYLKQRAIAGMVLITVAITMAWNSFKEIEEKINKVTVALGGTHDQARELEDGIFNASVESGVAAEKISEIATAFMSVSGGARNLWHTSADLYSQLSKIAQVTGISGESIGRFFGILTSKLALSKKQLVELADKIGSIAGLVGAQAEEVLKSVDKIANKATYGMMGGIEAVGKNVNNLTASLSVMGAVFKTTGDMAGAMQEMTENVTVSANAIQMGNFFGGARKFLKYKKAMLSGDDTKASIMYLKAQSNFAEKMKGILHGQINADDIAKAMKNIFGMDAKYSIQLKNQLDTYAKAHKELKSMDEVIRGFVGEQTKINKLNKRYKDSIKTINGLMNVLKNIFVSVLVPLVNLIAPVLELIMSLLNKMSPELKHIIVYALLLYGVWKNIFGIQKLMNLSNPLGWIIIAVTALAYLYKNCESFRDFVDMIWEGVKKIGIFLWGLIDPIMKIIAPIMKFLVYFNPLMMALRLFGVIGNKTPSKNEVTLSAKNGATADSIPQYESGTEKIPETGPAILHKGEAVINTEDNTALREKVSQMSKDISLLTDVVKMYLPLLPSLKPQSSNGVSFTGALKQI